MPTIFNVVYYILSKSGRITTMKLQKLAYYCQAWSLAWDEEPLFEEDFQAWANGPVSPTLYNKHRGSFVVNFGDFEEYSGYEFTGDQIETIKNVFGFYADKDPHWLSELIHKEDPWILARGNTPLGEPSSTLITKESMQNYYSGLIFNE